MIAWTKEEAKLETLKYKEDCKNKSVQITFHADRQLDYNKQKFYRGGYLFLLSLYYDCSNYYFEIEQEDGIKKYGKSKEHRPNPIVQMGLFMDGDGIPLAFSNFLAIKMNKPL